jgi:putative Mg2+ transporter-C (MgtC) family protein
VEQFIDSIRGDGVFVLRILVAMIFGSLVGLERQTRGRPAGLRTNILVCIGSAAIIVAFEKLSGEFHGSDTVFRMDPARAAAGVITGIGFLGAGTIVKSSDYVRGLTTAASIWVVAAIGVTAGLGEYTISGFLTLLVLVALYGLHRIPIRRDSYHWLRLEWSGDLDLLEEVVANLRESRFAIKSRSTSRYPNSGRCKATLGVMIHQGNDEPVIIAKLQDDKRFEEVIWE